MFNQGKQSSEKGLLLTDETCYSWQAVWLEVSEDKFVTVGSVWIK